jgi:branched-chain amino acid transport system permease protein
MQQVTLSLISGLSLGGTYALISLGLVLAFRATATLNFAHGELMVFPAFIVGKWELSHPGQFWIPAVVGLLVSAAICVVFYVVVLQRLTGKPLFLALIATFGLAGMLDGILTLLYGESQYSIAMSFLPPGFVSVGGVKVTSASLILTGFAIALALAVIAVIRFTPLGLRVRAAGQDAVLASQGGIAIRRIYIGSWAAAGVLAGVAGIIYGATNNVGSSITTVALSAFPAILLGGLDSIEGALVGSLIVGLGQGFVTTYLGGQYLTVITYVFLLVILLVRPQGLFGTRAVVRA